MNVEYIEELEDKLFDYFRKMKISHYDVHVKYIVKLLEAYSDCHNIEEILRDKLELLLDKNTEGVIRLICEFFKIHRNLRVTDYDHGLKKKFSHSGGHRPMKLFTKSFIENHLSENLKRTKKKFSNKKPHVNWEDISDLLKSKSSSRKCNLPCSSFLEKGVCLNGDTCKFIHKRAALVRPKLVALNSDYGPSSKVDYRSCILPEQNMCENGICDLRNNNDDDGDRISISSNDSEPIITRSSPPKIFQPPTLLDSPLWYKELGLVIEESVSSSEDSNDSGHYQRTSHRCLLVTNVPHELNRIGVLNKFFRRYGLLQNIEINFRGSRSRALVEFLSSRDMRAANKSTEAVLGNRFIKTRPYKRRHKRHVKIRRQSSLVKSESQDTYRGRRRSMSHNTQYSVESNRNPQRSPPPVRWPRRNFQKQRSNTPIQIDRQPSRNIQESVHNRISLTTNKTESSGSRKTTSIPNNNNRQVLMKDEHVSHSEGEIDSDDECVPVSSSTPVVVSAPVSFPVLSQERMQIDDSPIEVHNCNREEGEIVETSQEFQQEPEPPADMKLERALNDSDVESTHSEEDNIVRKKRMVVIDGRRSQLRQESYKNDTRTRLLRVSDSMKYYKAILETMITRFKKSDRATKSSLITGIKENHAKFMELKSLHMQLTQKQTASRERRKDPVEGEINRLQTNIAEQLSVSQPAVYLQVPTGSVVKKESVRDLLGDSVGVVNVTPIHSTKGCYAITFSTADDSIKACDMLNTNNPNGWFIGLQPPGAS